MDDQEILKRAEALIHEQPAMTLATAGDQGPWAAPVYYVYCQRSFFFFSDPETRHITEAMESGNAAAAIYPVVDTWQKIQGIQMSGIIHMASHGFKSFQAIKAYLEKFSFTRSFFGPGQRIDLEAFSQQFKVKLYCFDPDLVYYLDNEIRFGFRKEIDFSD